MDYLKGHNLASAPALFVICRHLATQPDGADEATLRGALQPAAVTAHDPTLRRDDVLPASLEVGMDIGLIDVTGTRRDRVWTLRESVRAEIAAVSPVDSRLFRSLLLRSLSVRALAAIDSGERPSDVVLALTWLLERDPLIPLPSAWGDGPEDEVHAAGLDTAIDTPEQWRALVRWARSLGLAADTAATKQKHYLIVDPTRALNDVLDSLPRQAPADQWFRHLSSLLPVLGHPQLVTVLPALNRSASELPASVALATLKLERTGRLRLVASDDTRSPVVLQLGRHVRQVGEVRIVEGAV